jgi:hypothetical protein
MAFYDFLPSVQPTLIDTPLVIDARDAAPRVLIIGTADSGMAYQPLPVASSSSARATFGTGGTLLRGIYEAKAQGAKNILAMRVGGTAASVTAIGGVGGWSVTTDALDDAAGARYALWYDATAGGAGRLAVFDNQVGEWVFDSDGVIAAFGSAVTIGEPVMASFAPAGGSSIGTASQVVAMEDVVAPAVYTLGSDGIGCVKMQMWEFLYNAYQLLDFAEIDLVVPMCVHLDEDNVADMGVTEIGNRGLAAVAAYPTEGSLQDVLGKVFVQEGDDGENYFWWDLDGDGTAEIFPTAGSATATTDMYGNTLLVGDFRETNFGYQLANFCHGATERWRFCLGVISFKPPTGFSLGALSSWIGKKPTYTTNALTQVQFVAGANQNGTGMLGNKFLAGRSNWRLGAKDGGLIATDDGYLDGTELNDPEGNPVDIGKYLNILGACAIHTNNFSSSGYISTIGPSYAAMISTLAPQSSPMNKQIRALRLVKQVKASKLDQLAGIRIVSLVNKPKGLVITDAPTAARPSSNFRRLTTVRIVKSVVRTVRDAADPFLGEPNSAAQQLALKTIIETALKSRVDDGSIRRYDFDVTATPQQRVLGQMEINMVLVPNFEVQFIPVTITLAAE